LKFIPNAAKGLTQSVVSGAAGDPIFDNLMMEAPTQAIQDFNNLTNVFFDTTLFTG